MINFFLIKKKNFFLEPSRLKKNFLQTVTGREKFFTDQNGWQSPELQTATGNGAPIKKSCEDPKQGTNLLLENKTFQK